MFCLSLLLCSSPVVHVVTSAYSNHPSVRRSYSVRRSVCASSRVHASVRCRSRRSLSQLQHSVRHRRSGELQLQVYRFHCSASILSLVVVGDDFNL
ncbi:non-ribosomal peptide synthase/polyketide synthase [Sesbania bispinosa]|nr:non-ribosomal peptide synthase/polyketide synthase [Sesbania bispinosa]